MGWVGYRYGLPNTFTFSNFMLLPAGGLYYFKNYTYVKNYVTLEHGEMAQWFIALVTTAEDLSSSPSTYMVTYNHL